jgi:hypothetical protein
MYHGMRLQKPKSAINANISISSLTPKFIRPFEGGLNFEFQGLGDFVGRLSLAVCVMKAMIFFGNHGMLHLVRQCRTMTVLEGPHTLGVKKAHAVAVMQDVTKVGLETGHGTQPAIDESDSPFLSGHPQAGQQIGHGAPFRKVDL